MPRWIEVEYGWGFLKLGAAGTDTVPNMMADYESEIDRLTTQLEERGAEIEQLRVQLAGCGVAAMCNTRESMQQQLCRKGDYGYSASYQDVVDAVSREIVLREENTTLRTQLAECEKEVERLKEVQGICEVCEVEAIKHSDKARKQVARECIAIVDSYIGTDHICAEIAQTFGLEGKR